jgi:hypothetical protein
MTQHRRTLCPPATGLGKDNATATRDICSETPAAVHCEEQSRVLGRALDLWRDGWVSPVRWIESFVVLRALGGVSIRTMIVNGINIRNGLPSQRLQRRLDKGNTASSLLDIDPSRIYNQIVIKLFGYG